jgi:hypothetical protein
VFGTMRLRPFAAFIAVLSMTHFTLVTGELECATASSVSAERASHETNAGDCGHMPIESAAVPPAPHNVPAHHSPTHGTLCCAALAGCAGVLASAESTPGAVVSVPLARMAQANSDDVPAPHFPPETPPPKA